MDNLWRGHFLRTVLGSYDMTQTELAKRMGIPMQAVSEIINGKKLITPRVALLLERALGIRADLWLVNQMHYDIEDARRKMDG